MNYIDGLRIYAVESKHISRLVTEIVVSTAKTFLDGDGVCGGPDTVAIATSCHAGVIGWFPALFNRALKVIYHPLYSMNKFVTNK